MFKKFLSLGPLAPSIIGVDLDFFFQAAVAASLSNFLSY